MKLSFEQYYDKVLGCYLGKNDEYRDTGTHIYKEDWTDGVCCPLSLQWGRKRNHAGEDQPDAGDGSKPTGSVLKLGGCNWRKNMLSYE